MAEKIPPRPASPVEQEKELVKVARAIAAQQLVPVDGHEQVLYWLDRYATRLRHPA